LLENYVSIAFLRPPNVVAKGLPSPLYIPRVGQQRNSHNLRNVHPVQAVCEFVRIKSSHAFAATLLPNIRQQYASVHLSTANQPA